MRGFLTAGIVLCLCTLAGSETPNNDLFQAIRNNDLAYLKSAVAKGADRNTRDSKGATLLMHAAAFGSVEAVKLLLDSGADVNARNQLEATALLWAADQPEKARLLIEKGADVNARSKPGRTPLLVAANCPGCSETVKLLIAKGADVKTRDDHATSAVRLAAWAGDFTSMRALIEAGAPADAADGDGGTALMGAAFNCDVPATKYLLSKGANVNAENTFSGHVKFGDIALKKLTPLIMAAPYCSAGVVQTLIDAGAQVNHSDIREMTPLMLAIASDRQDVSIIRMLIKSGADVNARSMAGETALDWARKFGNRDIVAALAAAGAKPGDPFTPPQRPTSAPVVTPAKAVENGAAILQRASTEFFNQSGCVGCHHQPITLMATSAARSAGVHVDEGAARAYVQMIEGQWTGLKEMAQERVDFGGLADQEVFSLLALGAAQYPGNEITDTLAGFVAAVQHTDGAWRMQQVARSPMEMGAIGRTAMHLRALQLYTPPARKAEFEQRIARGRDWLLEAKAATTDDCAWQIVGLSWAGASRSRISGLGAALTKLQREDGGWGANPNLASDPYATATSLWALATSGVMMPSDKIYQRGVQYLLKNQFPDGSWYVRSRSPKFQPYFQSGFPFDHDQWISSTATGWAVMAIAPAINAGRMASAH